MGGHSLPLRKTARTTKATVVDINSYEKKTHLVLQKTPFAALCRHIVEHDIVKTGLRFRAQSMLILQQAAESHLLALLSKAAAIVQHGNRITVTARDLELVYSMDLPADSEEEKKDKKMPKTPTARLLQLFRKAGIERAAADLYGATHKILHTFLYNVLDNANTLVQSGRTQSIKDVRSPTVKESDVAYALNSVNSKLYGISSASRPRRVPLGPKGSLAANKNYNRGFALTAAPAA